MTNLAGKLGKGIHDTEGTTTSMQVQSITVPCAALNFERMITLRDLKVWASSEDRLRIRTFWFIHAVMNVGMLRSMSEVRGMDKGDRNLVVLGFIAFIVMEIFAIPFIIDGWDTMAWYWIPAFVLTVHLLVFFFIAITVAFIAQN